MTGRWWVDLLLAVVGGLVLIWIALIIALAVAGPRGPLLREALRVLPDLLRLLRRLAADADLPRGVRIRLVLLFAYLALPFDLVPDFIPVLGYADDAIIVALVLRSVVRKAGIEAVRAHWPGSADGFAVLCRLTGLPLPPNDLPPEAPIVGRIGAGDGFGRAEPVQARPHGAADASGPDDHAFGGVVAGDDVVAHIIGPSARRAGRRFASAGRTARGSAPGRSVTHGSSLQRVSALRPR